VEAADVKVGSYYSNGRYGDRWSVRYVIEESGNKRPYKCMVIYRVVAGDGRGGSAACSWEEFSQLAKYEVFRNENSWQRIDTVKDY
jgi:CBS domain-containing membrane protein